MQTSVRVGVGMVLAGVITAFLPLGSCGNAFTLAGTECELGSGAVVRQIAVALVVIGLTLVAHVMTEVADRDNVATTRTRPTGRRRAHDPEAPRE